MDFSDHNLILFYLQLILFFSINFQWLQANAAGNETDMLSLLKFKQAINNDPYGVFNSWNDSYHFCNWYGVTCGRRHQRVTSLNLGGQNLNGFISPYIGNLSFLRVLNLKNNSFYGEIPQQVGNLFRLQFFLLSRNTLQGEVPSNLSRCSKLRVIFLSRNKIEGKIPSELGNLAKLQVLLLSDNKITGEIPPSLGNLSSLTSFFVGSNNLVGKIPDELGRLTNVVSFIVEQNNLSGIIPPSIFNLSWIMDFSTVMNQFSGRLPENIGQTLPNLQNVFFSSNKLSGSIPSSFSNASQLQIVDISMNEFQGQLPDFGNHPNLWVFDISNNILGNSSENDLNFLASLKNCSYLKSLDISYNSFGGILPNSIANLSVALTALYFGGNQFTGSIPQAFGNHVNLINIGMEYNFLSGIIPSDFGKLRKLQGLYLWGNRLSGQIPYFMANFTELSVLMLYQNEFDENILPSIGDCKSLVILNLAQNNLNGKIPHEVMFLPSLSKLLNLSHNSLTGNLPAEVGKLKNVNALDVAENKLSGEIPSTIGDCLSLEYLYMQGNSLQGMVPSSLASLKGLQILDLSRNNLTGKIPQDLQNLRFLSYLNLSFNNFEGQVPTRGVFSNASTLSIIGNAKLCGGVPELGLPKCPAKVMKKRGKHHMVKLVVIISSLALFVLLVLVLLFIHQRRKQKKSISAAAALLSYDHVRVTYQDLHQATSGFSSENLIGSGSFGSVYKAFLDQFETPVAIKVLKLQQKGASKSFMAECNALRNLKHRNLVKLLTYCSRLDYKRNEFKALVFEFMENGSLENWLHTERDQPRNSLTFLQRLNIAIDVASVLHYLHDLCENPIIHCDLKPSNVLLDSEMVAHVSDFGLSRLFLTSSQCQSSSIGLKGTFGYVPPEYAMGRAASREGDAYSYGILLLEMLSGKRPTDKMFEDGLNLHNFVKNALPHRLQQVIDQTLLVPVEMKESAVAEKKENRKQNIRQLKNNDDHHLEDCLLRMFKVGLACSTDQPNERMNMRDAAKELHLIKSEFLGVRIYA